LIKEGETQPVRGAIALKSEEPFLAGKNVEKKVKRKACGKGGMAKRLAGWGHWQKKGNENVHSFEKD